MSPVSFNPINLYFNKTFLSSFSLTILMKRYRLRKKELKNLIEFMNEYFEINIENYRIDLIEYDKFKLLKGEEIFAFYVGNKPYLTVRGVLKYRPEKKHVTIDRGAVKFITNGADVMAPGIVEVDPDIKEGDVVWIRDEINRKPLAIGRALVDAEKMVEKEKERRKGKVIKNLHYVGDKIWNLEK
jgi:PUA domain protein